MNDLDNFARTVSSHIAYFSVLRVFYLVCILSLHVCVVLCVSDFICCRIGLINDDDYDTSSSHSIISIAVDLPFDKLCNLRVSCVQLAQQIEASGVSAKSSPNNHKCYTSKEDVTQQILTALCRDRRGECHCEGDIITSRVR